MAINTQARTVAELRTRYVLDDNALERINLDHAFVGRPSTVVRQSISQWDRGQHDPNLVWPQYIRHQSLPPLTGHPVCLPGQLMYGDCDGTAEHAALVARHALESLLSELPADMRAAKEKAWAALEEYQREQDKSRVRISEEHCRRREASGVYQNDHGHGSPSPEGVSDLDMPEDADGAKLEQGQLLTLETVRAGQDFHKRLFFTETNYFHGQLSRTGCGHILSLPTPRERQDALDSVVQPLVKPEQRRKVYMIIQMFDEATADES